MEESVISHYKLKDLAVTVTQPEIEKLLDITPPHFIEDDYKLTWVF